MARIPPSPKNSLPYMVIWVDPGLTSGWASLTNKQDFGSGQFQKEELGDYVDRFAHPLGPMISIGWEDYNVTSSGSKYGTPGPSLKVIGMLERICHHRGAVALKTVSSSSRNLGTIAKLKSLGWYSPGQKHANDAAQHLTAWLIRTNHVDLPQPLRDILFTSS